MNIIYALNITEGINLPLNTTKSMLLVIILHNIFLINFVEHMLVKSLFLVDYTHVVCGCSNIG